MALVDQTATQLLAQLESGELTSVQLGKEFLQRVRRHDDAVKAFLRVDAEAVLARAEEIDRRRGEGKPIGLHREIEELQKKASFIRISSAALAESHVHDVIVTKQAPNYRFED